MDIYLKITLFWYALSATDQNGRPKGDENPKKLDGYPQFPPDKTLVLPIEKLFRRDSRFNDREPWNNLEILAKKQGFFQPIEYFHVKLPLKAKKLVFSPRFLDQESWNLGEKPGF